MALMTVNVSIKDTELFQHLVQILHTMTEDERIPKDVRKQYEVEIFSKLTAPE